jgi:hypothetical protein
MTSKLGASQVGNCFSRKIIRRLVKQDENLLRPGAIGRQEHAVYMTNDGYVLDLRPPVQTVSVS